MTTIAASRTHKNIACDLQFTHASGLKFKGNSKILTVPEPVAKQMFGSSKVFIGFCGNADVWGNIVSWILCPEGKQPRCKDIEFLALTGDNKLYHGTNLNNWLRLDVPHFSIGSGMQYAMGAMESGKPPKEAIKAASKYDIHTGMGVKVESI